MMREPDLRWRLTWRLNKKETELTAWLIDDLGKGYKLGSMAKRIAEQDEQLHSEFRVLMKKIAAQAMADITGLGGTIAVVDIPEKTQ